MCLFLDLEKGVLLASKSLRRKVRNFLVSVDRAFDEVGCPLHLAMPLQLPSSSYRFLLYGPYAHVLRRLWLQVLAGCVRRHGENWLWESVRQVRPLRFFLFYSSSKSQLPFFILQDR